MTPSASTIAGPLESPVWKLTASPAVEPSVPKTTETTITPEVRARCGKDKQAQREHDAHGLQAGHEVEDRQRQKAGVEPASAHARRAREDGVKDLQHDAPVGHHEGGQRKARCRRREHEVRGADPKDVAEQEVQQVHAGAELAHQRDAGRVGDEEEGAKRRIFFQPGQSTEQGARHDRQQAGHERSREERQRPAPQQQPRQCEAGQERVGQRITHQRQPPEHEHAAEQAAADA